jgi:hypothetical protein
MRQIVLIARHADALCARLNDGLFAVALALALLTVAVAIARLPQPPEPETWLVDASGALGTDNTP